MKRFIVLLCCISIISCSLVCTVAAAEAEDPVVYAAAPPSGSEFEDLAYYDISSSLGDIRLYLPYGFELNNLQLQDGKLYNVSNSTIYLFCPEYPDTTFEASRFQNVTYRHSGSDIQTFDLDNVSIVSQQVTFTDLLPVIITFCVVAILFFMMWRRFND